MAHYRYIRHGEKVYDTDEVHRSDNGKWVTLRKFYGDLWEEFGYDNNTTLRRGRGQVAMRRKIKA